MRIRIDNELLDIKDIDYRKMLDGLNKRIIRILYLRDDVRNEKISEEDLSTYITSLMMDIYGAYILFSNYRFLNCLCELQTIKVNIWDGNTRKKILDVASFINTIEISGDKK